MERRDFLKSAAGIASLPLMGTDLIAPVETETIARVALIKTEDRNKGIPAAIKLISSPSPKGKKVLIKPNFNTADPCPGSTHNDTLRQLLIDMKSAGAAQLSIGDRCGPGITSEVIQKKGIPELAREFNAEILNFEELPPEGWIHFNPPGNHWPKGFDVAKAVAEAEYLVWTPCLKTHQYGGVFSMSLKLAVGVTHKNLMSDLHGAMRTHMRRMIAEINQAFKPHLIVLDGIEAFVDGGPMTGKPAKPGVILAGTDRVAIDAVALAILKQVGSNDAIMKTKIFDQEQIQRAVELGLGVSQPSQIEIVTSDAESAAYARVLKGILVD